MSQLSDQLLKLEKDVQVGIEAIKERPGDFEGVLNPLNLTPDDFRKALKRFRTLTRKTIELLQKKKSTITMPKAIRLAQLISKRKHIERSDFQQLVRDSGIVEGCLEIIGELGPVMSSLIATEDRLTEEEIESLRSDIKEHVNRYSAAEDTIRALENRLDEFVAAWDSSEDSLTKSKTQSEAKVSDVDTALVNANDALAEIYAVKSSVEAEIEEIKNTIRASQAEVDADLESTKASAVETLGDLKTLHEDAAKHSDALVELENAREKLLTEIQDGSAAIEELESRAKAHDAEIERLLPGATSSGLAGAYQSRKTMYATPRKYWTIIFVGALVLMAVLSAIFGISWESDKNFLENLGAMVLAKLYFVAPLAVLAWFSGIRVKELVRIEEEYAYKESVSASYEGFRRQAEKLSEDGDFDLTGKLLDSTISSIERNPVDHMKVYSSEVSPGSEIARTARKSLKSGPNDEDLANEE